MTDTPCTREQELLDAIEGECIPDELRIHAGSCSGCSESLLVASFLRRSAVARSTDLPPLPDAGYVWWRAGIEQRAIASTRATRVITAVQRAAIVSAGLLTIPLARWAWPHLRSGLETINPAALAPSLPADAGRPGLVIAVSVLVVAALALLDHFGNWLEQ